jgi:RND family efflux transporter MFP subunit
MSDQAIAELRAGRRVGTSIDLVAPIDGVVLEQLAVVGQRVEAATAMLRVGRLDPLWLELQIPVAKLAAVRDGATVRVAAADAQARVIAIGRNINAANQTVPVRAVTTRGAERLLPGQSVEASLAAAAAGGQWSVPNAALVRSGAAASVFVQSPAGFRRQDVKVVSEGAERSLVAGDLRPGERIAVRGVAALKAAAAGIGVQ